MASREDNNQEFTTGATRSGNAEKKFDYEGFNNPRVERIFAAYMHSHRTQRDGNIRASDNWQEGIPIASYVKSFVRHSMEFREMWRGESVLNADTDRPFTFRDVLCAMRFNINGLILEMDRAGLLNCEYIVEDVRKTHEKEAGIK